MDVRIAEVTDREDPHFKDFLRVTDYVYQDDRWYIPEDKKSIEHQLFDGDWKQKIYIVYDENQIPAGRLCARIREKKNDLPIGLIGFFEAQKNFRATDLLIEDAVVWLKDQGCTQIIGPMNGDTWHKYRFNVGPWKEHPFLLEPYNEPYYPELWERAGFEVLENYYSSKVTDIPPVM